MKNLSLSTMPFSTKGDVVGTLSPFLVAALAALLNLFLTPAADAAITVVSYWRLGENDPGAAAGVTAFSATDSIGAKTLSSHRYPSYKSDVAATAANQTGSSLSVNFTNGAYADRAIVCTATDNFGIECWVKPTALGGSQVIAYNGITGGAGDGGWGLFIASDNTYNVLFGGVTGFGGIPATANVWTHLALVRASGTTTFYVNGAVSATDLSAPAVPSGNFALAATPQSPTNGLFTGLLDEVRVFTFADGQFNTNDLLWNQTSPAFVQSNTPLPGLSTASVAWGDYDNDGRLDILLGGRDDSGQPTAQVWRNTGNGFTDIDAGLTGVQYGSVSWSDYDNDGRLDILLSGVNLNPVTEVWRNTGNGFSNINAGLPGIDEGLAVWGDFDNDGRPDILISGLDSSFTPITQVWRNTGSGFTNINAGLPGVFFGSVAWGDYDNDGRLDILLSGLPLVGPAITQVWRNTGSGFTNINAGLPGVGHASVAWGDYDNDGRLDILLSGLPSGSSIPITQVWRNTADGFSDINAGLPGVSEGSVVWGDYDNDGRLDILLCGFASGSSSPITQVWRNTGSGFAKIQDLAGFGNVAAAAWGDYDNDGRLDILISGELGDTSWATQLWRNQTPPTNSPPAPPAGLSAAILGSSLTLSWNASSDLQTPVSGLSYNLRVGTTPGGSDILAPLALASGMRLAPQRGNIQGRQYTLQLPSLPAPGTTLHWSVQTIDTAFAGSPFAPEAAFTVSGSTLPVLTGAKILPSGAFQFSFTNNPAGSFTVLTTTNVSLPLSQWTVAGVPAIVAPGVFQFTSGPATNGPRRFYSVRSP